MSSSLCIRLLKLSRDRAIHRKQSQTSETMPIWLALFAVLFACIAVKYYKWKRNPLTLMYNKIPGPDGYPFVGNLPMIPKIARGKAILITINCIMLIFLKILLQNGFLTYVTNCRNNMAPCIVCGFGNDRWFSRLRQKFSRYIGQHIFRQQLSWWSGDYFNNFYLAITREQRVSC